MANANVKPASRKPKKPGQPPTDAKKSGAPLFPKTQAHRRWRRDWSLLFRLAPFRVPQASTQSEGGPPTKRWKGTWFKRKEE